MSDTPETDGEWNRIAYYDHPQFEQGIAEFARKLERERDDLREIFPKILEALESGACAATCSVDFLREIPREVKLVRQRLERGIVDLQNTIRVMRDDADVIVADRDYWRDEAERWRALSQEHDDEVVIDDQTAPYGEWWEVQK